jgi:hypothetical protein
MIHLGAIRGRCSTLLTLLLTAIVAPSAAAAAATIGQNPRYFVCQMWTQTQTATGSATHNYFSRVFTVEQSQAQDVEFAWVSYVIKTFPSANNAAGHRCANFARQQDAQQMMDYQIKQVSVQPQNQVDHVDWAFSPNQVAAPASQPVQTAPSHCQHMANEYALAQCKAKWGEQ